MASVNLLYFTCHSLHHHSSLHSTQQSQSQSQKHASELATLPLPSLLLHEQHHVLDSGMPAHEHSLEVIEDLGVHGRGHDIPVADAVLAMLLLQVIL